MCACVRMKKRERSEREREREREEYEFVDELLITLVIYHSLCRSCVYKACRVVLVLVSTYTHITDREVDA